MSFLGLEGKRVLVMGLANKKSVAFAVGHVLQGEGARVVYSVRSSERKAQVAKLTGDAPVFTCDVEAPGAALRLAEQVGGPIHGIVHSIAFARYSEGARPFHEVPRADFLQSVQVSCHSLIEVAGAFRPYLDAKASIVTISISTTRMAADNYGFMAPVKAALDASVVFLAKSLSGVPGLSEVRVNAVCPGLLKTSASAGIPGYVDSYLFAEKATLRKRALETREVADTVAFLLSPRSSGINAQGLVIDAGMGVNYFDRALVSAGTR